MAIAGNKGEWSEIYVLLKLLGEGVVYAGDGDLEKIDNLYYPIINIIRQEERKCEYMPDSKQRIVVINEDGIEMARIPMSLFLEKSEELLNVIKTTKARSFEVSETERFMKDIKCRKLKAASTDKADIHIIIHDLRTGMRPLLGFSIKSQLGGASTLLNAGHTTNVKYRVSGVYLSDDDIAEINAVDKQTERMELLRKKGGRLNYSNIENKTFKNNLIFIDSQLPKIVADCLAASFTEPVTMVSDIVKYVAQRNPLGFDADNVESFYEHKIKNLLIDVALGMTPASVWQGRYDATGGYLVVRKDGEIVCFHFYNRNDVEDYLYNSTYFERASRSRYDYGYLYRDADGGVYMRLNLQIRFK